MKSTARIGTHPIHPMLIPLPIGLLSAAAASDVGYWLTRDVFWARASRWLIGGGLVTGAAAALFGITDFVTLRRPRERWEGWLHGAGNAVVLGLAVASLRLRAGRPERNLLPWGLLISAVVASILLVTGWLGGELSYRYQVGVNPPGDDADAGQ